MLRTSQENAEQVKLIPEQKRMIKIAMDSFLNFSSTKENFIQEVKLLNDAIFNPLGGENRYAVVRDCFLFPENYLPGLERYNPNTTVGSVKLYVLYYINTKLQKIALNTGVSLEKIPWNSDRIAKLFIGKVNHSKKFVSAGLGQEEEDDEWINVHNKNDIYKFSLSLDPISLETTLSVTILYYNNKNNAVDVTTKNIVIGQLQDEQFETDFLSGLIPEASVEAEQVAKQFVLNTLMTSNIISKNIFVFAKADQHINAIITKQFYLNEILEKRLNIFDILNLTSTQAKILSHSLSIFLLKNNLCLLSELLNLAEYDLEAASLFQSMLTNRTLHITHFYKTPPKQTSLWAVPIVNRLIQSGNMSFEQGKIIPIYLRPLFMKQAYINYFPKNPINWRLFSTIDEKNRDFFLQPEIISLVVNGALIMRKYSAEFRLAMERKTIYLLFSKKLISADDLNNLSLKLIELIDTQPHFYFWLESGLILVNDINPNELDKFYVEVCTQRFHAIMRNQAFTINSILDTFKEVIDDLSNLAIYVNVKKNVLLKKVMKNLLGLIREDLLQLKTQSLTDYEKHFFNKILRAIDLRQTNSAIEKIRATCADVMIDTNSGLSISKHKPFVFFKNHTNNIKTFCSNFVSITASLEINQVNKRASDYGNRISLNRP